MPITENARIEQQQQVLKAAKERCNDVIKAAARYERMESNQDFQDILKDLQNVADIHKQEIAGLMALAVDAPFFKRIKFMDAMMVHQIRMDQLTEAISYTKRIVFEAKQARDWLDQQREKEKSDA